jgi:transcription elongation factor GreB
MSKAFTRESESDPAPARSRRPRTVLPPGVLNYITTQGAAALRAELDHLLEQRRGQAASSAATTAAHGDGDRASLQVRIEHLEDALGTVVVVPSPPQPWDCVRFGASVRVRVRDGAEAAYRIVGVDETDSARNWVSWRSPVGAALLRARLGQRVRVPLLDGDQELEILGIDYG